MSKQWVLTGDALKRLLAWLDPDCEQAGEKYRHIQQTLVQFFAWNGCHDAEDWADETIDRVAKKLPELTAEYKGDPALYFYGVAKHVLQECRRKQLKQEPLSPTHELPAPEVKYEPEEEQEEEIASPLSECMVECMARLKRGERKVLTRYYLWRGRKKIDSHRDMASKLKLKPGTLRVKVHRARAKLDKCIAGCMERKGADETIWWKKT